MFRAVAIAMVSESDKPSSWLWSVTLVVGMLVFGSINTVSKKVWHPRARDMTLIATLSS